MITSKLTDLPPAVGGNGTCQKNKEQDRLGFTPSPMTHLERVMRTNGWDMHTEELESNGIPRNATEERKPQ